MKQIRIATRRSALAQWQARWVAQRLQNAGYATELVLLTSEGDIDQRPITDESGRGLFTRRIQEALLNHEGDIAVHSLKDLPTAITPGLKLAAIPTRASVVDCLVTRERQRLDELPHAARVGTGSRRRAAQLMFLRPDLRCEPIRGNVETRLRKVLESEFDAIVLAEAGLARLELAAAHRTPLSLEQMLPAPGQGALGIEIRDQDQVALQAVQTLNDPEAWAAVTAERRLLSKLQGGCLAPIAAYGRLVAGELRLSAVVLTSDGKRRLFATGTNIPSAPESLGEQVADLLLAQGAAEIVAADR